MPNTLALYEGATHILDDPESHGMHAEAACMILVTGATGVTGRVVLGELHERDADVRALARDHSKAESLEREGFAVARADFADRDALMKAMDGVDAVFLLSAQHPDQAELQNNVVDAAAEAGARSIVKLSAGSAVTGSDSPAWAGRAHWETEEHIRRSGLGHTFLRPNYFMKNLLGLAAPIRSGTLAVPANDQATAMIDHRDVAAVAAEVLTSNGAHDGKVYDLTGPESIRFSEVADRIGRVLDVDVKYVDPPLDAVIDMLRSNGAPEHRLEHVRQLMALICAGRLSGTTDTVHELTGRPPKTIDEFVRDNRAVFDQAR